MARAIKSIIRVIPAGQGVVDTTSRAEKSRKLAALTVTSG